MAHGCDDRMTRITEYNLDILIVTSPTSHTNFAERAGSPGPLREFPPGFPTATRLHRRIRADRVRLLQFHRTRPEQHLHHGSARQRRDCRHQHAGIHLLFGTMGIDHWCDHVCRVSRPRIQQGRVCRCHFRWYYASLLLLCRHR